MNNWSAFLIFILFIFVSCSILDSSESLFLIQDNFKEPIFHYFLIENDTFLTPKPFLMT